jgi:2-methylcitrate dehydratase PrpD
MDVIYDFINYFMDTRYEDLTPAAKEVVKTEVIDSLGTALGGSSRPGIGELVDLIEEWGGTEQSTVIAYGLKCPAPNAALVNGAMIHALDYDDGHQESTVHMGCTTVSTGFATGERMGGISGRELITCIALGIDFMARLSLASRPGSVLMDVGWHPTVLYGYLGTAAIAGRIMGLNRDKMANALGIAYHQCSGNMQCIHDGVLTKRVGPGLAARGGITAALMAERGITGARNCLQGKAGLFNVYQAGDYNPQILTAELGKRFETENNTFKPYPNCGHTHAAIDAVFSLKAQHHIKVDEIEDIAVYAGGSAYALSVPLEAKRNPQNIVDAQFSLPWAVATALVKDKVTLEDFTEKAIKNEEVLQVSRKVTGYLEPGLNRHGVGPSRVMIRMKDGAEYTEHVEFCLGSVERPTTFDDSVRKFRECYPLSRKPLSNAAADEIIDQITHLEQLGDATEIIRKLG